MNGANGTETSPRKAHKEGMECRRHITENKQGHRLAAGICHRKLQDYQRCHARCCEYHLIPLNFETVLVLAACPCRYLTHGQQLLFFSTSYSQHHSQSVSTKNLIFGN
ncbi:hypothetical protein CISIN_1g038507mg [Citrus sinensis]|uniref:Uncharacterized protein n=1 Tax=Citrus sinensis TaxID=2711 RepID=A0A067G1M1_CITSI|nr:hypothetical protein CISIN_1g038507mg [Citrus sinensis]